MSLRGVKRGYSPAFKHSSASRHLIASSTRVPASREVISQDLHKIIRRSLSPSRGFGGAPSKGFCDLLLGFRRVEPGPTVHGYKMLTISLLMIDMIVGHVQTHHWARARQGVSADAQQLLARGLSVYLRTTHQSPTKVLPTSTLPQL